MKKKGLLLLLALVLLLVGCSDDEITINEDDSFETKVQKIALKEVHNEENIIETTFTEDIINDGQIVRLELNGGDKGRMTLLDKSKNIFEKMFDLAEVTEVQLLWKGDTVDQYGKKHNENALKIMLKKETADKIGWDLFDINKFEDISDSYWINRAYEH